MLVSISILTPVPKTLLVSSCVELIVGISDYMNIMIVGVAYLHGYRVQQSLSGSKKHAFEIIPPDPDRKHYYFHTESDADRRR